MLDKKLILPNERIIGGIFLIRGQKVMLDSDLAALYGVETKILKRSVKRNIERFPSDFMLEVSGKELKNLRYHFGTSSWGGTRYKSYAFTEQGVAMLSSVLNNARAIQVNIQIIRIFTRLRKFLVHYKDLKEKIEKIEQRHDKQFQTIFEAIKRLTQEEEKPKRIIGFKDRR